MFIPGMPNNTMKKAIGFFVLLTCCLALALSVSAEEKRFVLPDLNEEGFFSEAFCLEVNPDDAFEWNATYFLLFGNISEEGKTVLNEVKTIGQVYEVNSITFYPNGTAHTSTKATDQVFEALSTDPLFKAFVPQTIDTDYTYRVDIENHQVILHTNEDTILFMNEAEASFSKDSLGLAERYCVPSDITQEAPDADHYTILSDIAYGDDPAQLMDIYLPDGLDGSKPNAAFVLIYGGGWTSGDKTGMESEARRYANAGYIAMTPSLRNAYVDEEQGKVITTVFDMLNDVQYSIRKLAAMSDENGWNLTQCALWGGSSGANVAMLYSYTRNADLPWFDTEEILPVRFVVEIVGPVDMHDSAWYGDEEWPEEDRTKMTAPGAGPLYAQLLTGYANRGELTEEEIEECINAMSPVWYVQQGQGIPTLMGYSKRDLIQNPNNGKILKGYLDAANVRNDLYCFEKSVHSYVLDLDTAEEFFNKSFEYADTYFLR